MLLYIVLFLLLPSGTIYGLVLHPGHEHPANWKGRPHKDVVAKFYNQGTNKASVTCVIISPNWALTARHNTDANPSGKTVVVDGTNYDIESIIRKF